MNELSFKNKTGLGDDFLFGHTPHKVDSGARSAHFISIEGEKR
jgi:hypothetical protein